MFIDINKYIELNELESLKAEIKEVKQYELENFTSVQLGAFAFDSWHLLKDWLRLSDSLEEIVTTLEGLLTHSLELAVNKLNEEEYLWLFGYMLEVGPENFMLDYFEAEEKGKMFLDIAVKKFNNPVAKVLSNDFEASIKDITQAKEYIRDIFGDTSGIYVYFDEILNLNIV